MGSMTVPTEPWRLTASEAATLMRNGDMTVEDYAKSLLSRIKQRDSEVNAWAYLNPHLVLARARELDAIAPEKRGPLHGVAVGVKDVILTKDMPTQHNSPIFVSNQPSTVDAGNIMTLRANGALIFGKTTTTEFAACSQGDVHQNLTSCAHDPGRTPGGSSSGSGASCGDFQVPLSLGTQTGGSTIRPGSFNGIYAFKPTWGAISREGLAQYSMTCDTLGLYSRSPEDLELLSQVFQLKDDKPVPSEPFSVKGSKIAFIKTHVWPKAGPGTKNAWEKAKDILTKEGATVEEIDLPEEFANFVPWHEAVLAGEGRTSFLGAYTLSKDLLHDIMQGHVENKKNVSRKAQLEAYDGSAKLRPVWDDIASKYDAVLTPSAVDEAPKGLDNTGDASFCSMWTLLHAPMLNIPGFAGENGLPIGLSLVSPRYTDQNVVHVAKTIGPLFEKEGGWTRKNA
ncbi:amidase [Rhizodiscina lignyota]|uniref:Amidase n=1 Tax=Rhizodiscina lignyota TaxID=1504668 RepID=A0A9P4INS1_9PEZI|nr:amidase [Rhizodiscina lignyota]